MRTLSLVLADQADRALQAIAIVQQNLTDELAAGGVETEGEFVAAVSGYATHEALASQIAALPQANAINIIDANGTLLNSTRSWPIPSINVADRDYFKAMVANARLHRYVSEPVTNRVDGRWTIFLARRVESPAGQFLGLVLGAVELEYFKQLYSQIMSAPDYSFGLIRSDGVLLVRTPEPPGSLGRNYVSAGLSLPVGPDPTATFATARVTSPIDGVERLVSTDRLAHFPIWFSSSRTVEAVLARWRRQVAFLLVGGTALIAGLWFVIALGSRGIRDRNRLVAAEHARDQAQHLARSEQAIREHLTRFGVALDNMAQGLCMFDAAGRLVVANEQVARVLEMPRSPPIGSSIRATVRFLMKHRSIDGREIRLAIASITRAAASDRPEQITCSLRSGRSVLLHAEPSNAGGLLLTFTDVTNQREAEAQIAFLAHFDPLTKLPNRASIVERLAVELRRLENGYSLAVLHINLRRFREINDTFGRSVGDLLLREIAARLRSFSGQDGFAARVGADEFVVIMVTTGGEPEVDAASDRLQDSLMEPCALDGRVISVGIRVGVKIAGEHAEAESVLQRAQMAMHHARDEAVDRPVFFRAEMLGALQARRQMEAELLLALQLGDLEVHYQPLVRLATRKVVGFESLLRWHHPVRGLIRPDQFVPIAEQTGLIVPIGEWVLRTACSEAARWPTDHRIAVNLSAVQVRDRRLLPTIRAILAETGMAPNRLEFEITESVLLRDTVETLETLHELRKLGAAIALDDFGTGFSSLSYLRSFPFDKVKIDRSFVRDLGRSRDAQAIVHAILNLCAELGIGTLAEGIELEEQADTLLMENCRDGQGYLFGHPTPVPVFVLASDRQPDLVATG